ncbi:hypothetical protein BJ878DRAFT_476146 [Calycina marina]|uniref:Uncharacterized protein n=1 Tax=Calycina marina TaxID=1763456 RepID=A0A9P7ZBL5_9HELO|nr:hypothetical protein BJ878DRAFT_476146 [Calycina marina]
MASRHTFDKSPYTYEPVLEDGNIRLNHSTVRSDNSGIWNSFKAWYLFGLHFLACILMKIGLDRVNHRDFKIGSAPTIFTLDSGLYQAQVTGPVSLALVIIRIIAGSCSGLLISRTVFILLEKRVVSLSEITRLTNWRLPVVPGRSSSISWSLWAISAILLLWPQSFAAPFASSSISWIPVDRVLEASSIAITQDVGEIADWDSIMYDDMKIGVVVSAAAMTAKSPAYVYNASKLALRRYFNSTVEIPDGSNADITVPYIAIDLRWIDASSDSRSQQVGQSKYQFVNEDSFSIRNIGAIAITNSSPFSYSKPTQPDFFNGTKLVGIKLRTLNFGNQIVDASQCGAISDQHNCWWHGDRSRLLHIRLSQNCSSSLPGKDCTVSSSAETSELYATCSMQRDDGAVQPDWLSNFALEFMSEALKFTVLQNYSQPYITKDLTDYTTGTLTRGYHSAWSALMKRTGNETEPFTSRASETMVSVLIDRNKLFIWLAMNASLTISVVLVPVAKMLSTAETIRDTTVAALTMDLTEITRTDRTEGLCNAVALSKQDKKLP